MKVDYLASVMVKNGRNTEEVDVLLERLSLEMNGNMYNYWFMPSENYFKGQPTIYKSTKELPTEKQIMFALGKIGDIADGYLEKLDSEDRLMDFETFETLVESIIGKPVSGVPILNMLASVGEVIIEHEQGIRW